jgi:hypothetical protein
MLDGVGESQLPIRVTPILPVREEDEDEDKGEDEDEVAGEEWTLTHHPPLLVTLLLSCSWRGRLEGTTRTLDMSRSLDTRWRTRTRMRGTLSMDFVSQEHGVPRDGPKDSNAGG